MKNNLILVFAILCLGIALTEAFVHKKLHKRNIVPPVEPEYFITEWVIYTLDEEQVPPYDPSKAGHRLVGTGRTYYDWTRFSMLEVYD